MLESNTFENILIITNRNKSKRKSLTFDNEYDLDEDGLAPETLELDEPNELLKPESPRGAIDGPDLSTRETSPMAYHDMNFSGDDITALVRSLDGIKHLRTEKRKGITESEQHSEKKFVSKYRDLKFEHAPSIFDKNDLKNSDFYGIYIIFWLGIGYFIFNQMVHHYFNGDGSLWDQPLVELFKQDIVWVGLTDLAMYLATYVSVLIQMAILRNWFRWPTVGQLLQSTYEIFYVIFWCYFASIHCMNFNWLARVFLVLHSLVFLMKMHSYAFYNGYLWGIYKELKYSKWYLKRLRDKDAIDLPQDLDKATIENELIESIAFCSYELEYQAQSTSLSEGDNFLTETPNDIIKKASQNDTKSAGVYFPDNITFENFFTYSMFPTVVYTLNFPRTKEIRWQYVFEKVCGIFGIITLMIIVAQDFMYPLVMQSIEVRKLPINERLGPFLLILLDMVIPFLIQYIFVFFLIWDQILNAIAELSRFADRDFYGPWWSSSDWADFARLWNKPVHRFLLRHVYHSSIASVKANKLTATLLTFVISSIVHEFVMYVIFNLLRGYLFLFQMSQIPLVMISRSRFMKNKKILGILICWTGFMTGPSIILTLYLVY